MDTWGFLRAPAIRSWEEEVTRCRELVLHLGACASSNVSLRCFLFQENSDAFLSAVDTDWKVGPLLSTWPLPWALLLAGRGWSFSCREWGGR